MKLRKIWSPTLASQLASESSQHFCWHPTRYHVVKSAKQKTTTDMQSMLISCPWIWEFKAVLVYVFVFIAVRFKAVPL